MAAAESSRKLRAFIAWKNRSVNLDALSSMAWGMELGNRVVRVNHPGLGTCTAGQDYSWAVVKNQTTTPYFSVSEHSQLLPLTNSASSPFSYPPGPSFLPMDPTKVCAGC